VSIEKASHSQTSAVVGFFLRHPVVGLIGTLASVVSLLVGFVFFYASRERPGLTYFVNPGKAAVVRTGQTSRLAVQFDGAPLSGDVTAVQVAFWNAGKKPIRMDSVLRPMVIRTKGARILEANVRKTSRDVVGVVIDTAKLGAGELGIRWNILEANDGGVLQLVYEGSEKVSVEAEAVLVGQRKIENDASSGWRRPEHERQWINYVIFFLATGLLVFYLVIIGRERKRGRVDRFTSLLFAVNMMLWVVVIAFTFFRRLAGPPFGF
jgi:hypothetical protein